MALFQNENPLTENPRKYSKLHSLLIANDLPENIHPLLHKQLAKAALRPCNLHAFNRQKVAGCRPKRPLQGCESAASAAQLHNGGRQAAAPRFADTALSQPSKCWMT
ncbi:hypothetical protein [Segatella baroniae]|uniref:Uncharacterized protein n=1 Tax=Segatella baroniae F0067 TaxID=1115809 RepID=U2QHJ6_9BACT|nr:hypothetical protein [Segatella baroniae]ERK38297.1 hypothetical protein HMPREF9135_0875 [Segatella baroniae F0067]